MMSIFNFFKPKQTIEGQKSTLECPDGYFLPQSSSQLLSTKERTSYLQTLWDYSSLPAETYELFYKKPLSRLAELMQLFPGQNQFSRAGGMLDRCLMLVAYSSRIAKQYMLPIGATPEEQSAQSTAWHAIIIYKALYESIRPFSRIYVQTLNGSDWRPFEPLTDPFRFRTNNIIIRDDNLIFNQLLTSDFLVWISKWPNVYETFLNIVNDSLPDSDIVSKIVNEALALIDPNGITNPILNTDEPTSIATEISDNTVVSVENEISTSNGSTLSSAFDESENTEEVIAQVSSANSELEQGTDSLKHELISLLSHDSEVIDDTRDAKTDLDASPELPPFSALQPVDQHINLKTLTSKEIGQLFLDWLVQGISTGELTLNSPNSFLHVSSGYLFIRSPNIFSRFIRAEKSLTNDDRKLIQTGFERLEVHKQASKSIFSAIMTLDDGNILKLNGYLVPISFFLQNYLHFNLEFVDNSSLVLQ